MCTASWRGCDPEARWPISRSQRGQRRRLQRLRLLRQRHRLRGRRAGLRHGVPGICAGGTTQCANGGMNIKCRQDIQPRAETCNLLDDDCDGIIDNPDAPGLCPTGQVCSKGVCVSPCSNGEFPCAPPTVCDTTDGLCKDPRCMNATCARGSDLRSGRLRRRLRRRRLPAGSGLPDRELRRSLPGDHLRRRPGLRGGRLPGGLRLSQLPRREGLLAQGGPRSDRRHLHRQGMRQGDLQGADGLRAGQVQGRLRRGPVPRGAGLLRRPVRPPRRRHRRSPRPTAASRRRGPAAAPERAGEPTPAAPRARPGAPPRAPAAPARAARRWCTKAASQTCSCDSSSGPGAERPRAPAGGARHRCGSPARARGSSAAPPMTEPKRSRPVSRAGQTGRPRVETSRQAENKDQ